MKVSCIYNLLTFLIIGLVGWNYTTGNSLTVHLLKTLIFTFIGGGIAIFLTYLIIISAAMWLTYYNRKKNERK